VHFRIEMGGAAVILRDKEPAARNRK